MNSMVSLTIIAVILIFVISNPAFAFRCGERTVNTGDTIEEVISKCGEPTGRRVISYEETGSTAGIVEYPGRGQTGTYYGDYRGTIGNPTEILVYNCGEGTLVKTLTFQNGKLQKIRDGDRGKGPKRCY